MPIGGGNTTVTMLVGRNIDFFWNAHEVDVSGLGNYSQFVHFTITVLELDTRFDVNVILWTT